MTEKVALITGSTRGIGRATASRLLSEGWTVGINGREPKIVQEACIELGLGTIPVPFDVSKPDEVSTSIRQFVKETGRLDGVVHAAGIMEDVNLGLVTEALVEKVFRTNVFSGLYTIQAALKPMSRQRSGSIVLIGSMAGQDGAMGQSIYSAAKGSIPALVQSAAKEIARLGIRVNAVAPGLIDTDLVTVLPEEVRERIVSQIPMKRIGQPSEVSAVCNFLLSDDSSYITGQVIRVDGGARA